MFCSNCGKELRAGAKFCAFCGSAVLEQAINNLVIDVSDNNEVLNVKLNDLDQAVFEGWTISNDRYLCVA